MRCPSCNIDFHFTANTESQRLNISGQGGTHYFLGDPCPRCKTPIILYKWFIPAGGKPQQMKFTVETETAAEAGFTVVYPRTPQRPPLRPEVPEVYTKAFGETCLVMEISPKASAALSRRLLQLFIHDELNVVKKDLAAEIQEIQKQHLLPTISNDLDHVRLVGNWAAHPNANPTTGEIVDVEPGEAEYLISLLERLLETHFVDKARSAKMQQELVAKQKAHPKPAPIP